MAVTKTLFFGGNWKAAMTPEQTKKFFDPFLKDAVNNWRKIKESGTEIMIGAPAACLQAARESINYFPYNPGTGTIVKLGVQNPWHRPGAYTGATTFKMAEDSLIKAKYAIIGHSENREPWRITKAAIENAMEKFKIDVNPD